MSMKLYPLLLETLMGHMPKHYIEAVYKWLKLKGKDNPENLNKAVSYLELSKKEDAIKSIIQMAKEIKHQRNTIEAEWPEEKEFNLTDQWQEVPANTIMPPGAEYRMDLANEKTYARILKEQCELINNTNKDLSQLENIVSRFYPYVKKKLGFEEDAKVILISDPENAKDPWGKTAYYNPEAMEITVFVDNRHPKDMLRSLSHELVHHSQNCRGDFQQMGALEPGYTQKDPHMRRMEGEAYLLGNGFLVRDFEDLLKQNLKETIMKGLTEKQLKTVLENTLARVMKESKLEETDVVEETEEVVEEEVLKEYDYDDDAYLAHDAAEQQCRHLRDEPRERCIKDVLAQGVTHATANVREEVAEKLNETYETKMSCEMKGGTWEASDEGPSFGECDHGARVAESFTSKKDRLLFERLTKKWAK